MKALLWLERDGVFLAAEPLALAAALCSQGFDITGVLFGSDPSDETLLSGAVERAIAVPLPDAETFPFAGRAATLAALCRAEQHDTVFFANSTMACDLAALLGAKLDAGVIHGLTAVRESEGRLVGTRRTLSESLVVETAWTSASRIGLFRTGAFAHPGIEAGPPVITNFAYEAVDSGTTFEALEPMERNGIALRDAKVIVGAGRGIGKPEALDDIRALAEALGGTLGVSLPLVDLGWAPRGLQVGQTGTVVQPRLYVACGISGQIQHRIGIEGAGTIVAINKDRDAPIMGFCDLAVVGDLRRIVSDLLAIMQPR